MFHSLRSNMPPSASAGAMFSCGLPRCLCCFPAHCGSFITAPPLRTRRASIRPLSCCFCRSAGRVLPLVCCCAHFKRLRAAFHNLHSRIFRHGIFDLPRLHPVQIRCFRLQQRDSACGQHRFLLYALFHLPLCGQHGRKTRKISCRTPIHCAHCFCGSGCDRFLAKRAFEHLQAARRRNNVPPRRYLPVLRRIGCYPCFYRCKA